MKRYIVLLLFTLLVQSLFSEDKYVHFSIDDVNPVFKDLTLNKDKYNNIFDHDFFGFLKELNEKYGTKVTLYCFYSLNGFNISDCTDKFKNDFAENSKWLKIGYHSFSENYTFVGGV